MNRTRTWPVSSLGRMSPRYRVVPLVGENGSLAFDIDFTSGLLPAGWTFARAGAGSFVNASGAVVTVGTDVARFGYDPTTLAPLGLLMEGEQINYLCWSETFATSDGVTNNWVDGGQFIRQTQTATAPDGTATALRAQCDELGNATCINSLSRTPSADSGAATYSISLRRVSGSGSIQLTQNNGASWTTVGVSSSWKRFELTPWLTASGAQQVGVRIADAFDTIEMWGAQLNDGAGAGSYLKSESDPTNVSGANFRKADKLSCLSLAPFGGFTPTASTLLLDLTFFNEHSAGIASGSAYPYMMGFYNGSNSQYALQTIYNNASLAAPRLMCHTRDGANAQIGSNPVANRTANARMKYAVSLSGSGTVTRLTSANGASGGSFTDGTGPVMGADRILFHGGAAHYDKDYPSYYLRRIAYWREAMTQAQLNALTG